MSESAAHFSANMSPIGGAQRCSATHHCYDAQPMITPVVLSGGSGTRLWPLSRELYPKQLLPLVSKGTMLQETLARLSGVSEVTAPIVVCNDNHRFLVAEQLRDIKADAKAIVLQPVGRNTAPAVAVAALAALSTTDSNADPVLLVLP